MQLHDGLTRSGDCPAKSNFYVVRRQAWKKCLFPCKISLEQHIFPLYISLFFLSRSHNFLAMSFPSSLFFQACSLCSDHSPSDTSLTFSHRNQWLIKIKLAGMRITFMIYRWFWFPHIHYSLVLLFFSSQCLSVIWKLHHRRNTHKYPAKFCTLVR